MSRTFDQAVADLAAVAASFGTTVLNNVLADDDVSEETKDKARKLLKRAGNLERQAKASSRPPGYNWVERSAFEDI